MPHSRLTLAALIASITLSASGCIIHVGGNDDKKEEYSSVFGGLDIEENRQVDDLSSVNGNINLKSGVSADDVTTVNGGIKIGKNVRIQHASTVNGDIKAKNGLTVERDMSTVNGTITLKANSSVKQDITTVNGSIKINGSMIGGDVESTNGDISLQEGSVVEGDIIFKSKDEGWWGKENNNRNLPKLTIDASSNVKGKIVLQRKVVLEIENQDLLNKVEHDYREQE